MEKIKLNISEHNIGHLPNGLINLDNTNFVEVKDLPQTLKDKVEKKEIICEEYFFNKEVYTSLGRTIPERGYYKCVLFSDIEKHEPNIKQLLKAK